MTIVWYLLVLGFLAALWGAWWGLRGWWRTHGRQTRPIEIPVLGPAGVGKTLFLARLLQDLLHRPHQADDSERTWAVHLLSEQEERRLRGHALDELTPGLRSTKAMIATELTAWETTGHNAPTLSPERAYLRLYLKRPGAKRQRGIDNLLCAFTDLPGSYFEANDHHEANLYPLLRAAHGLIVAIDATGLDPADHRRRIAIHDDLYAEVVAKMTEHCPRHRLPLWVTLTCADCLKPGDAGPTPGRIAATDLDALLPRLAHLPTLAAEQMRRYGSLTSAQAEDARSAQARVETWAAMMADLAAGLALERKARRRQRLTTFAAALASTALALLLAGLLWRQWGLEHLPDIEAGERWTPASVEEASAALIAYRANPLFFLDRPEIDRRLGLLDAQYRRLLEEGRMSWWQQFASLGNAPSASAVAPILRALEAQQAHLRRFIDHGNPVTAPADRARALRWLREGQAIGQWLVQWETLSAVRADLGMRLRLLARVTVPHVGLLEEDTAALVAKQAYALARDALDEAGRHAALPVVGALSIAEVVQPWRAWRSALAGDNWSPLLSTGHGEALMQRYQVLREAAWQGIWERVATTLEMTSDAAERAEFLRRFKEDQEALGESLPAAIDLAWQQAVDALLASWQGADGSAEQAFAEWVSGYRQTTFDARLALKAFDREARARGRALTERGASEGRDGLFELRRWIGESLVRIASLPGAAAVAEELEQWRERGDALVALAAPQAYQVRFTALECERNSLNSSHDEGWLDFFQPYLRILVAGDPEHTILVDMGPKDKSFAVSWMPWTQVRFAFYDQDGKRDPIAGQEDDDALSSGDDMFESGVDASFASLWTLAAWQGVGCAMAAEIAPTLPDWLSGEAVP